MPGLPGPGVASEGNWFSRECSEPVVTVDCRKRILQCHIQETGFPGNSTKGNRTSPFRLNLETEPREPSRCYLKDRTRSLHPGHPLVPVLRN